MLKAALLRPLSPTGGTCRQQLDYLRALGTSTPEVFRGIADSVLGLLAHALAQGAKQLSKSSNASAQKGSGKFWSEQEGFSLSYGSLTT